MADKSISELVAATSVGASDLFVLQQSNTAKKLTGQTLENWLLQLADGHGGIQSIAKTSTADLVDTYTVTLSDLTTYTFTVTNGKGVASVQDYWAVSTSNVTVPTTWQTTVQTMTVTNRYLWHYQVFTLNDSATTPTTLTTQKSVVGVYGDTGDDWYVRIRFADIQPTRDEDMYPSTETSGHPWIGLYSGTDETIPEHYTSYLWYKYKGDKGDTGNPSTLTATEIKYGVSNSESLQPTEWTDTMPTVVGGQYLWTRTTLTFNTGSPVIFYSKARWGTDGTGSGTVTSVNEISPVNGNVTTMITGTTNPTTATIGQTKQVYLNTVTGESFVCTGASGGTYTWKDLRGHVDNALSTTSEYPVMNKIVKTALDEQSADIVALEAKDTVHDTEIGQLGNAIGMRGWNQLCNATQPTQTIAGVTYTNNGNGTITVNGTATGTTSGLDTYITTQTISGHKYYFGGCPSGGSTTGYFMNYTNNISFSTNDVGNGVIFTEIANSSIAQFRIYVAQNSTASNKVFKPQLIDLTALFGAGNEPTTVQQFRQMFGADYYPYCSGSWADLLWTNSNPTASFSGQTISLNLANYSSVYVVFLVYNQNWNYGTNTLLIGSHSDLFYFAGTTNYGIRSIYPTSSSIVFGDSSWGGSANNDTMIPYKIFGLK